MLLNGKAVNELTVNYHFKDETTRLQYHYLFLPICLCLFKKYKMKLGDSIVAATALIYGKELYSRNVIDFSKIAGLVVVNPII